MIHVIAFFSLLFQSILYSQILPFRHFTRDEGLVANDVTTLYQDSLKYLWNGFSERHQPVRRTQFVNYTMFNGLPSNYIDCFAESEEWFWVGTNNGLCRTPARQTSPKRSFQIFRLDSLNNPRKIYSLLNDKSGTLWCATEKGLYRVRGDSVSEFRFNGKQIDTRSIVQSSNMPYGLIMVHNCSSIVRST